ncbi:MAG: NAD(P)-dependent oxidoreductase [Candidatus Omnitrophica bacterium]|nr:NAD(P)-dependent oxidoreductase [Candidatus Omnitrophota bacterium]
MTLQSHPRMGFLGLGTMGTPMAANLLKAGFPLTVWNRTAAKMESLLKLGAKAGKGPAQVAAEADVVITMVSQPKDVEDVALRPDGVVDGLPAGAVYVDMSTVSPATSRKLAGAVAAKQAEFLDAPVVGSKGPATDGTLVILVGGLPTTLERCRPIFSAMGKTIIHAGGVGSGAALKLATNLMLAHLAAGFSEGLLLVERAGLDPKKYLEVLEASTFRSPWYQTKGIGMIKRDFSTHFALKHMRKDLRLMSELAEDITAAVPITKAIEQLFAQAEADGRADLDYSAILAQLEHPTTEGDYTDFK